jgi:hypothetical protein
VEQHDHGVLAAELEGAGDEVAAAGLAHLASGAHAAGEADLVDAGLDQGGAGLAVALDDVEQPVRQAGLGEEIEHETPGEGRDLGRLDHHRVAGEERLHRRVERQDEGAVPGRDDPDDAERAVGDDHLLGAQEVEGHLALGEHLLGVLGEPLEGVARGEDLHEEGLHARAAGVADDDVDEALLLLDEDLEGAPGDARALLDGVGRPAGLDGAGAPHDLTYFVGGGDPDLADRLAIRGASHAQPPPGARFGLDRFHAGHGADGSRK